MRPTRYLAIVALLPIVACAAPTPSTPSPRLTPTGGPIQPSAATASPVIATASPSAEHGVPPRIVAATPDDSEGWSGRPRSASSEVAGVRLTVDVGDPWMQATYPRAVTVTITNASRRRVEWLADGCDANASVVATTTATWRDSPMEVPVELAGYRDRLRRAVGDGPIRLAIQRPYPLVHRARCADFGESHRRRMEPGESVAREYVWDGGTAYRLGPPPDDMPVRVVARLERWRFVGGKDRRPIQARLDTWIMFGHADAFLSPFEAIDVALADERLSTWLMERQLAKTDQAVVEFDRSLGIWVIGVLFGEAGDPQPVLHAALIDPMTREVFAVKENRVPT